MRRSSAVMVVCGKALLLFSQQLFHQTPHKMCCHSTSRRIKKTTQSELAPCGLRGCKNGPAPFRGRMSYKATKPGLVCLSYLSMLYYCIVVYWGPFLCIVSFRCCVFCLLVVLAKLSLPSDWLERLLWGSLTVVRDHLHKAQAKECT